MLTQLTCQEIKDQTSRVPHWLQLDPYSSLEEASSVVEESENSSDTKAMKRIQSRYTLHERTRTYHMARQHQSATSTVFYHNMCADMHSAMISGNNKKTRPGLKSPSDDRIAEQQKITDNLDGKTPPMAPTP